MRRGWQSPSSTRFHREASLTRGRRRQTGRSARGSPFLPALSRASSPGGGRSLWGRAQRGEEGRCGGGPGRGQAHTCGRAGGLGGLSGRAVLGLCPAVSRRRRRGGASAAPARWRGPGRPGGPAWRHRAPAGRRGISVAAPWWLGAGSRSGASPALTMRHGERFSLTRRSRHSRSISSQGSSAAAASCLLASLGHGESGRHRHLGPSTCEEAVCFLPVWLRQVKHRPGTGAPPRLLSTDAPISQALLESSCPRDPRRLPGLHHTPAAAPSPSSGFPPAPHPQPHGLLPNLTARGASRRHPDGSGRGPGPCGPRPSAPGHRSPARRAARAPGRSVRARRCGIAGPRAAPAASPPTCPPAGGSGPAALRAAPLRPTLRVGRGHRAGTGAQEHPCALCPCCHRLIPAPRAGCGTARALHAAPQQRLCPRGLGPLVSPFSMSTMTEVFPALSSPMTRRVTFLGRSNSP